MPQEIRIITLPLPYRLGSVNCYLVGTDTGYVLIDTGSSNSRRALEGELERAGCEPGLLKLIMLTHGDFDHTGNAAYLRDKFDTVIAMHEDDAGMAEFGDMFWSRESSNVLLRMIAPLLFRFPKSSRFAPDIRMEEGTHLSRYGFDAQVLSIPGHSKGSVGILTAGGALFCGDLLDNTDKPVLNGIMDDLAAAKASVERLKGLGVDTVYPGHGQPFAMETFLEGNR
jgi:hydroxyacylglutathione hydrolase